MIRANPIGRRGRSGPRTDRFDDLFAIPRRSPAQGWSSGDAETTTRRFSSLVAETLDCPDPIVEFGSFQVEGQESYANLRELFPGRKYVGCDMRPGPGVDLASRTRHGEISLPDGSAGTVLCIETF